jgi:two-component system response regulator RegA
MQAEALRSVLVVDDDTRFADTLARALGRRGWAATVAYSADAALAVVRNATPDAAIVDLRIAADDGMELLQPLRAAGPAMRIIVLTGYASIATAVKAIKLGADDYLAKPVTAAAVAGALSRGGSAPVAVLDMQPMSPRRLEWEHIQRVLTDHDGNISATARTLRMHRRTLQRKLAKRPTHD